MSALAVAAIVVLALVVPPLAILPAALPDLKSAAGCRTHAPRCEGAVRQVCPSPVIAAKAKLTMHGGSHFGSRSLWGGYQRCIERHERLFPSIWKCAGGQLLG